MVERLIDKVEIQRAWSLLVEPGQIAEIRILEASTQPNSRYTETLGGFFDNPQSVLQALQTVKTATGFYITLQVCKTNLINRAYNRLKKAGTGKSTADRDVRRYRWLLIDSDIHRSEDEDVSGISSTDEEHGDALGHSRKVAEALHQLGWPEPIVADSGNGGHLLYRIDLPLSDAGLVERALKGLAERYNTEHIHIDCTVFNPSRICKLYGSLACKGDSTRERPHRMSRLLEVPEEIEVVNKGLLEAIAFPEPMKQSQAGTGSAGQRRSENMTGEEYLIQFCQKHGIRLKDPERSGGYTKYVLADGCIFDRDHGGKDAALIVGSQGGITYHCFHNSCANRDWRTFRENFEPDAYTSKQKSSPRPSTESEQQDQSGSTPEYWLAKYDADDSGNGDALNALYGKDFLWCSSRGWFRWCGTHWQLDTDSAEVKKSAVETLRRRRHAAVDAKIEAVVKCCKADDSRVNGAVSRFKTLAKANIDEFDANPDLLNCKNGVINLRTGQLLPHHRDQRFTYCVPVDYGESDYAEWLLYLDGVVGGGIEVVDYLQQLAGYSLTGHTREEILVYLHGPSRSGKGTWAETFMKLLPDPIATMVDFNSFTARREGDVSNFDLAPLKSSRMIFASESQRNQSLNPAKIKQLTGGDQIRACYKHRDFFSYRPQFKVWMLSNHPVNGDPEDDALWGRVRVIEFPNSFLGNEDKSKKENLKKPEVLQGVLWWAVQGAIKWYSQGAKGLQAPEAVVKTTMEHRAELDYVQQWLDECAHEHEDGWTANEVVIASYMSWCKDNNVQYPKGAKALSQSLKAKGFEPGMIRKVMGKTKRGVGGLHIFAEEKPGMKRNP
jgi:P4 family phage/plasmid primase-like protien